MVSVGRDTVAEDNRNMSVKYQSVGDNAEKSKRKKRFLLGLFILLIVDVLWVASAELTEYIFKHKNFDKPFFTTYSKTILFMSYFAGFLFYKPWQFQCGLCIMQNTNNQNTNKRHKKPREACTSDQEESENEEIAKLNPSLLVNGSSFSSRSNSPGPGSLLTDPTFENMTDDDTSTIASDLDIGDRAHRRVTFNKIREIRHLSEKDANAALLARMSHSSIDDLQRILSHINSKLPLTDTMRLALMFCVLWMCGSFFYQEALANTSATVTNILSSTSGLFTLILSSLFQSSVLDKFSLSKLLAVSLSIGGITIVSLSDPSNHGTLNQGAVFALLGALCYATYLVMLTRKVGKDGAMDIPLFFGFVGLFAALMFWPVFFLLHYTGVEKFKLPPDLSTWLFIVVNGIFGTVLAELLWLWGCFLTSSLIGTLALGLVTPMTMACDMIFNKLSFSWMFIGGTLPVFLSFFAVSLLGHFGDWDPIMDFFKWILKLVIGRCRRQSKKDGDQYDSLIRNEMEESSEIEIIQPGGGK